MLQLRFLCFYHFSRARRDKVGRFRGSLCVRRASAMATIRSTLTAPPHQPNEQLQTEAQRAP